MPAVSEKQQRAMWAAAEGHSTLGIPRSVGKEYVGKDSLREAAGTMFLTPDGKVLLLRRGALGDHKGAWCFPGGGVEDGEAADVAAVREANEEIGGCPGGAMRLLDHLINDDGTAFSTFVRPVEAEFAPTLNEEHTGHIWAHLSDLPAGLHPGTAATLNDCLMGGANDMTDADWTGLVSGFVKWASEEQNEEEHADDEVVTTLPSEMHYAPGAKKFLDKQAYDRGLIGRRSMALDRKSVRTYDADGHLHVTRTPISKANVCEYYGHEIPDSEALGLDPQRRYRLLRHPEELAKAAKTSNGKPLLLGHTPTSADDHQFEVTVGAVGTDAEYVHPYLYNSLSVWDGSAIGGVESGEQKELSSAYRYRADMTPGTYLGVPYDGVMRDIDFNHVALVPEGRAGADVVVGDSKPNLNGEIIMSKKVLSRFACMALGSTAAYLAPKLAQDSKIDLTPIFDGVSKVNFKDKKGKIAQDIKAGVKLAKDASLDDVTQFLDKLENCEVLEGADADPSSGLPLNAAELEKKAKDEKAKAMDEFLKGKLSAEDKAAYDELMGRTDADDEEDPEAVANAEGAKDEDKEEKVSKSAMDAAIKKATEDATNKALQIANDISTAKDVASKWVGRIAMDARRPEDVYKLALDHLKVDVKDVHPSAYRKILEAQPVPGDDSRLALDSAPVDSTGFSSRWGGSTDRIAAAG